MSLPPLAALWKSAALAFWFVVSHLFCLSLRRWQQMLDAQSLSLFFLLSSPNSSHLCQEVDENRIVTYVNKAAFSRLGVEEGFALDEHPRLSSVEFLDAFDRLKRRSNEAPSATFEMVLDSKHLLIVNMDSLFESGAFCGAVLFVIFKPVSVRDALQLKSMVLDSMPQAVLATDPLGNILAWNLAATKLYGYSENEALGTSVQQLLKETDSTGFQHVVTERIRGNQIQR